MVTNIINLSFDRRVLIEVVVFIENTAGALFLVSSLVGCGVILRVMSP